MFDINQELARIERATDTLRLNLLMHLLNNELKGVGKTFQRMTLHVIYSALSDDSDTVIWFVGNEECAVHVKKLIDLVFPKHRLEIKVRSATLAEVQDDADKGHANYLYCDWR